MEAHALAHGITSIHLRVAPLTIHAWLRERGVTDYAVRHPMVYVRDADLAFEIKLQFG
jgi:hypothetical protein